MNVAAAIGGLFGATILVVAGISTCITVGRRRRGRNFRESFVVRGFRDDEYKDMESAIRGKIGTLPIFSYEVLRKATNDFDDKNQLGDGGHGSVYLGKLPDSRAVAVKKLYHDNYKRVEQFFNEVQILSTFYHPHLVRLYGCSSPKDRDLLLVYEYVQNGTLADHLHGERKKDKGGLNWDTRLKICIETAKALAFLHSLDPPLFHRDVKSANILLDEDLHVKVGDFGLSRFMPLDATHISTAPQGTPGYIDPDYHICFQLTDKSDVYSFGVVLMEIISAKIAVDISRSKPEIILANMAIAKIQAEALHEFIDPNLDMDSNPDHKVTVTAVAKLAFKCLAPHKEDRPDMKNIVTELEQIKQNGRQSKHPAFDPPSPISVQEKWHSIGSSTENSE
jgi:serine/threonine protein kinase